MRRVAKLALLIAVVLGMSAPAFAQVNYFNEVFECVTLNRAFVGGFVSETDRGRVLFNPDGSFLQIWGLGGTPTAVETGLWSSDYDMGAPGRTVDAYVLSNPEETRHSDLAGTYVHIPGFPWYKGRFIFGNIFDADIGEYVMFFGIPYRDLYGNYPFAP